MTVKEKIIAIIEKIDDQELLLFILVIIEDSLQWQQVTTPSGI